MNYFSYGSNMSSRRLLNRIPSARKTGSGMLRGHQLKFHKISIRDGSGKCNILETANPQHIVYGVLYQIEMKEKETLDIIEGLNNGYNQKEVEITLKDNSTVTCFSYYATKIDETLKPFGWYMEHVLRGAKENKLPKQYIDFLEKTDSVNDKDVRRREMELSVYHQLP